jgi:hypothetical protein
MRWKRFRSLVRLRGPANREFSTPSDRQAAESRVQPIPVKQPSARHGGFLVRRNIGPEWASNTSGLWCTSPLESSNY